MSATAATTPQSTAPPKTDGYSAIPPSRLGDPTWELALSFPRQGEWTETDYLSLNTNRLVELSDGCLEFLPMALPYHQLIVGFLYKMLDAFVISQALGHAYMAPMPVRLWQGKMREPDILFIFTSRLTNLKEPPNGAELAMEVVSEGAENREHDLVTKREEYARARIPEYWIIDPEKQQIIVLTLDGQTYREHGVFGPGTTATSVLLPGFEVEVDAALRAGQGR